MGKFNVKPNFDNEIWTDRDFAAFIGVPLGTFQGRCRSPVEGEVDVNDARPFTICGRRFWRRTDVLKLLGIAPPSV